MIHVIVNPPSKTVQGLAEGTLRTTMTHLIPGDTVLVMTATADPDSYFKAAPPVAPKRAIWAEVVSIGMSGVCVAADGLPYTTLDYTPQTAITIKDRTLAVAEVPIKSTVTVKPWVTAHVVPVETVTVTGSRVHRSGAPCGIVHDDDTINGDDVAMLSGEPVPLVVMYEVTIEEAVSGRGRKTFAVWSCRGKRKATRVNRRRSQVSGR